MEDFAIKVLSDFGVPTLVCFFLLFKGARSMDTLAASINNLVASNARLEQSVMRLEQLIISHIGKGGIINGGD